MRSTLQYQKFNLTVKRIFLFAVWSALFFVSQNSWAQQIFPVTVNGSLIPPHSLSLQDYSFDKSDDIMYLMTLIDPVEETRAVKFRLTVKNNGNPIIETNPNYNPAPVILEQQIPLMINGVDLAGYFDPLNLVRVNGGGQGGGLLPSGFNSICLEVIDMERGVPISDQFCLSGIFELAQPPLLNLPICHNQIPLAETENMVFSWTAMHQLSLNQPMGVEYEFTLIKLLPGIADPNDGFNFAIPVLQTTINQTFLYYLQDNPPLEAGETYAWRVQAKDIFGNDLFQNGGYSNVCTFQVAAPVLPPDDGTPGFFSCGDGACDYTGPMSNIPFSGNLSSGEQVAVGNFKMTVSQISNNGGSFSGEGTIYIPFIFSKLKVTFDDIQINKDLRVFNGNIKSTEDNNSLIPSMFSIDEMGSIDAASVAQNFATEVLNGFSDATAVALENHFDGGGTPNVVSLLQDIEEGAAIPIGLPIGIDKEIPETNSKLTMAISAIEFSPTNANMNAILVTKFTEGGQYVKFGARGICFQPQGIAANNPRLELLSDVDLEEVNAPLTLVGIDNGASRTYLSFDCNGFEEFSLTGRYLFDKELIKPVDVAEEEVILTVQAKTKSLTDFIATVDPVGDFQFVGAEDFTFNIGGATFDFSPTENPAGIIFPENFPTDQTDESFKGFYLSNASVNLPDIFSTTTDGAIPKLLGTSILVTTAGFTGSLTAEDLINLETGDIGGWSYSMDSAFLNIVNNSFDGSGFVGKMKLPIMSDTEFLKYEGGFSMGTNGVDINFDILPDVVTIDLLRASFQFDPTSKISIGRLNGAFQMPTVDLNGVLSAAIPEGDPGFVGDIMVEIDNLKQMLASAGLGDFIPKFDMEGIKFEGFKIDLNAPDKFSIGSITPVGLDLNFLGIPCDISSINFSQLAAPQLSDMNINVDPGTISRALNFNMDFAKDLLGIAAPKIQFNLVINELPSVGGGGGGGISIPKFKFGGFDLSFGSGDLPSFSCGQNIEEITAADFQDLATEAIAEDAVLKIGHFELTPDFPLTDDGAGTISGEGIVEVPILGPLSKLKVSFDNVKVDQAGRIIQGEVVAAGLTPPDMGGLLGKIDAVKDGIAAGVDAINGLELPLVMGVTADGENERDQGLILVGLVFGPTEAKTKGKVVFEVSPGKYAEFTAEGLTIVPDGIADFDIAVGLASDLEFQPIDGLNPLVFKAYDSVNKTGSFVKCDCKGFQEFRLGGEYEFSKDQIISLDDPEIPVKASFDFGTTKWGEFIGQMESMGNFTIPGLEGFDFVVSDAYLDFSSEENVIGVEFPEEYKQLSDSTITNTWKGFFIREIGLTLPEAFVLTEGAARPQFTGQNLLIDPSGVSTTLIGQNIIDGEVEGWAFKMDSVGVNIVQNGLVESGIKGLVGIPIIDDQLPYVGSLLQDDQGFYKMSLAPQVDTRLNISALRSYIDVGGQTEIVLQSIPHPTLANKTKFKPYADLYGGVGVDVSMQDFNEFIGPDMVSVKEFIETTLGIGAFSFTPPAITFEGFKINHPVLPDTSNFRLDNYAIEGGIAVGDHELGLSELQMLEASSMKFKLDGQEVNLPGVGLSFSIGIPLINIDLEFWAKEQTVVVGGKSKQKFSFGKINIKTSIPKFACDGDCPEPPTDQAVASTPVVGESFKSGDFTIKVTEANKGTVNIGFLNADLNVAFSDVKLNAAGELVGGTVNTVKDAGLFSGDLIKVGVEGEQIQLPLMDKLTDAVNDFAKLPFSLNSFIKNTTGLEEDLPFDFIVVGMRFTPEGAKLDAMVLFGTPDGTQLKFGATGLCITPQGVNLDQIKLFIAEEISLNDWEMPITILPGNSDGDDGSFATFSCSGLDNFHLQARYDFPTDQLIPVDETLDNVAAYFTIKSATLGQFMANATMDKFMVAGVDDVIFEIKNANIDYSDTQNPDNFPEVYFTDLPNPLVSNAQNAGNGNNLWRGFYLELVSVGLPESLSAEGGDRITLEGTNLIYDKANGMSAALAANNLLKLKGEQGAGETGDINGWAFSIDKLAIDVKFNSLEKFSLDGKIHIPVTAQGDEIAYEAAIGMDDNNKPTAQFTLKDIDKEYSIPFLGSTTTMDISEGSVVGIKYDSGGFQPFSDVSGAFSFALESPEFKIDALTFENFKINDFDMPAPPSLPNVSKPKTGGLNRMSFKGFKFAGVSLPDTASDPNATPAPDPAPAPVASPNQGNEKMGGFPINISNIKFASVTENGEDLKRLSFGLGVNFSSGKKGGGGGIAGNGSLAIYGKLNLGKLTSEPWKAVEFKKIDVGSIEIKADMGPVAMYGGLVFIKDDPVYGEGFKGLFDLSLKPTLRIEAVGQFGVTKYDHAKGTQNDDYRYFFVDGKGTFFPGVGAFGVAIYGFGGGLFFNMAKEDLKVEDASFAIDESGDPLAVTASTNAEPTLNVPPQPTLTDPRLEPGVSLSGAKYFPQKGILGLKATVIAGLQNPQILNAEATLGIEINYETFGLKKVYFEGDAFILCKSILEKEEASVKGSLDMEVDLVNKQLRGTMDFTVAAPFVAPIITGGGHGAMKFSFAPNLNPLENPWFVRIGTPLQPLKLEFGIPGVPVPVPSVEAYFMAGDEILDPKPITDIYAGFSSFDIPSQSDIDYSTGAGVAFGARLSIPKKEYEFLMFTAGFEAGIGFDVNMKKYLNVTCGGEPLGLAGWYMKGRAYAYLEGRIDMDVDVFFYEGRVNLCTVSAAALMQAELPNPTWMSAQVKAAGSVLDGLIEVDLQFKVEIGERCDGFGTNPLADISIITDFQPTEEQTGVPVYFEPRAAFSRAINESRWTYHKHDLVIETINDDAEVETRYFAPYLKSFVVRKNNANGAIISTKNPNYTNYNKGVALATNKILEAQTWYYTKIEIGWLEFNEDTQDWFIATDKNVAIVETREARFKTGDLPDKIVPEMLSYHAPGDRQRNWHRDYADPMIEFKQQGFEYIFDESKWIYSPSTGYKKVFYDYKYKITDIISKESNSYPLTSYPNKNKPFERYELEWKTVPGSRYKFPIYKKITSYGTKVEFGTLDDHLEKNRIYKLEIIGVPRTSTETNLIAQTVSQTLVNTKSDFKVTSVDNRKLKSQNSDPTKEIKVLYEYHFKTSKYNSLNDKLNAMNYRRKSKGVKRNDISHPTLTTNYVIPTKINEPDDYYIYSSDEGFDKYDIERLRKNVRMNHAYVANQHPFETTIYYSRMYNYSYRRNWDEARAFTDSYDYSIWKYIKVNGKKLHYRNQLKPVTDKIFRKHWEDLDYGTRIMFPKNMQKVTLSDWEINNRSFSQYVQCTSCWTDGYSSNDQWAMSITMARRRVMLNQWAFMNFLENRADAWEADHPEKVFWDQVKVVVQVVVEFFVNVTETVTKKVEAWWNIFVDWVYETFTKTKRVRKTRVENRTQYKSKKRVVPGLTVGTRMRQGLDFYARDPRYIYHNYWRYSYLNYGNKYYFDYTRGGINRAQYRKSLTNMDFLITFYKPYYGWRKMGEKASGDNVSKQFRLKDGF